MICSRSAGSKRFLCRGVVGPVALSVISHFQLWNVASTVKSHELVEHQNGSTGNSAVLKILDGYSNIVNGVPLSH